MKIILGHLLLSFLLFVSTTVSYSQFTSDFNPSAVDDTIPKEILDALKTRLALDQATTHESKAKVNEFINEIYEKRFEYVVKCFNADYMMVNTKLSQHLTTILDEILKSNPQIKDDIMVFPFRSDVPNAMSFGNGVLAIMLGLISDLENDDQIAFTICHELAHEYLKHAKTSITQVANLNYDKDLKKQFTQAKNSQYNSYSKLKELMNSVDVGLNKHSRVHEFEADSLGLVFYLNTSYKPSAPLRCMQIFDSVDIVHDTRLINFKKYFDYKDYKFKDTWLAYAPSAMWHKRPDLSDSGKTHPSCAKRSIALRRQLLRAGKTTDIAGSSSVNKIGTLAKFESLESEYHFKEFGKALFNSLLLLNDYPENIYLHSMVGRCLFQLYVGQKKHELGKVLSLPDERYPENYNRFLTFIHKLRLSEIASISYYYVTTKPENYFKSEHFLFATWLVSCLDISQLDPESIKEDYINQFPRGLYIKEIKKGIKL